MVSARWRRCWARWRSWFARVVAFITRQWARRERKRKTSEIGELHRAIRDRGGLIAVVRDEERRCVRITQQCGDVHRQPIVELAVESGERFVE